MNGEGKQSALRFNPQMLIGLIACLWIIMGSFPTGWLYDLGVGTGAEQGQKPDSSVSQLHKQADVEQLFLLQEPTTAIGHELVNCPLMRLRDLQQEGTHYTRGHGIKKTVNISEYCAFTYPSNLLQTVSRLFLTGAFYNSYHLIELEDGSYICAYFDDYLLYQNLLNGEIDYPTGYIRYTTTEERRMLNQMSEDYDVNPVYVLDMYRYGKASWMIDLSLRLGITFVVVMVFLSIEKVIKRRLAKFLEVRRYG